MHNIPSLLPALFLFAIIPPSSCFSPAPERECRSWRRATRPLNAAIKISRRRTLLRSTEGGDSQAEIAALEERLRQLKSEEAASSTEEEDVAPVAAASPSAVADDAGREWETPRPDDAEGELEGESEDSVMFSERWKEAKAGYAEKSDFDVGGIAKVGLGVAFVIFLAFFSQVPVGQDSLQRYQDVKGNVNRIDLGDLNPVADGDL